MLEILRSRLEARVQVPFIRKNDGQENKTPEEKTLTACCPLELKLFFEMILK